MKTRTQLLFTREHTSGTLKGMHTMDHMRHVDRWHAAQWLKGVRRNSRLGRLDYKLVAVQSVDVREL